MDIGYEWKRQSFTVWILEWETMCDAEYRKRKLKYE